MAVISCLVVFGGCGRPRMSFLSLCQMSSMGLRSGELAGWKRSGISWSENHFFVDLLR